MSDYKKVWEAMNELDLNSSKLSGIKEVLFSATTSLENHDYDGAERLLYAATDLVNFYTETFDREFQKAWGIVIPAAREYQDEQDKKLIESAKEKKSWVVPVEVDDVSGEYFVTFPDELIELTGWKTDDVIRWVDNNDGTFSLVKSEKKEWKDPYAEDMIKAGYEMVDGVWTLKK
jgi:bifunctional DNA-binding transcriptional regulator/antitoxin component of YhaV-PrlF toxin-antitoxin module